MKSTSKNKTKKVFILPYLFPVRSEAWIKYQVMGLAARNWQVTVLARNIEEGIQTQELENIDKAGVSRWLYSDQRSSNRIIKMFQVLKQCLSHPTKISWLKGSGGFKRTDLFYALEVIRILRRHNSPIIHVHFGHNGALLAEAGWKTPTIVSWHGSDANVYPNIYGVECYKKLFDQDWWHTVGSDFMYNRLLEIGAREDRIVKIPVGTNLAEFPFVDRTARPSDSLKVILVGRLEIMKGHTFLIKAVSLLLKKGLKIELKIIGEGSLRSELENEIQSLHLNNQIKLLGACTSAQVYEHLVAADLFALTGVVADNGRVETQGVVFAEAQATGLPVIGCDVGGVSESLVHGKTGMLVPPKDINAIAEAIEKYASNRELRFLHGQAGTAFVRKNFSIEKTLDELEDFICNDQSRFLNQRKLLTAFHSYC